MVINHNIAALNTYGKFSAANKAQAGNMEKLSSGLRINRAGDDAAGLAISEKMRGQIRGLDMASKNAQDATSLIQTAEGALNETHSILQRMRELAVQAANDTNTLDDRKEIQKEVDQLVSEIDRIANTTEFNTKKLLNGNASGVEVISGADNISAAYMDGDNTVTGEFAIKVATAGVKQVLRLGASTDGDGDAIVFTAATATTKLNAAAAAGGFGTAIDGNEKIKITQGTGDALKEVEIDITADMTYGGFVAVANQKLQEAGIDAIVSFSAVADEGIIVSNNRVGSDNDLAISLVGFGGGATITGDDRTANVNAQVTLTNTDGESSAAYTLTSDTLSLTSQDANLGVSGLVVVFEDDALTTAAGTEIAKVNVGKGGIVAQIGANEGQTIAININNMQASALGKNSGVSDRNSISALKVDSMLTQSNASKAITVIDKAIKDVSAERSKLGAYQNRLDHTINNLGTSSENLTAAESRIRDVDMAKEIMQQTKNAILSQAAQAMLAQANQQPQGVLQLLQ